MDSFLGIGILELVFIIIFALIFLGPERLPQVLRDIIGAIRKVRSLTSDITQQLNEEFGDLAELDPRRQIQQALKEDAKTEKTAKKPASSTSAAKTGSSTKNSVSTNSASANKSSTSQAKTTAAQRSTSSTAKTEREGEAKPVAAAKAVDGTVKQAEGAVAADASARAESKKTQSPAQASAPAGEGAVDGKPAADEAVPGAAADDKPLEGAQPPASTSVEQISPASAYFAQKIEAEKENGVHSASNSTQHAAPVAEEPQAAAQPVIGEGMEKSVVGDGSDNHTIAPPSFPQQEKREEESNAEPPVEIPVESTAKEDRA